MRGMATLALGLIVPSLAWAGHYVLTPITIPVAGASSVYVTVLNQEGDFGGTYGLNGQNFAFVEYRGQFQTLPPIPGLLPGEAGTPTAVTPDGQIGGVYGLGMVIGFVFRNGAYVAPLFGPVAYTGTLGLNSAGDTFITGSEGRGEYSSAFGRGRNLKFFSTTLPNNVSAITSLNERGNVAGIGRDDQDFVCIHYSCREISIPNELSGLTFPKINDLDQVAGLANEIPFLLNGSVVTQYTLPHRYIQPTIGGLGNDGTIAGTVAEINGPPRVFALKNGRFQFFGAFQSDVSNIAVFGVTANGSIGVAAYGANGTTYYTPGFIG